MSTIRLWRRWIGLTLAVCTFLGLAIVGNRVRASNDILNEIRPMFHDGEKAYVHRVFLTHNEILSRNDASLADYELVKRRLGDVRRLKSWKVDETDLGYHTG